MLRLLTNPLYLGKVEHSGALYAGEQAALVEPSVWEPIQEEVRTRVRHAPGNGHPRQNALLNVAEAA